MTRRRFQRRLKGMSAPRCFEALKLLTELRATNRIENKPYRLDEVIDMLDEAVRLGLRRARRARRRGAQ